MATSGTLRDVVDSSGFAGFAFAWYSGIGTKGKTPPPLEAQAPSSTKAPALRSMFVPPTNVMKGMSHSAFAPRGRHSVAPGGRETNLAGYVPSSPLDWKNACPRAAMSMWASASPLGLLSDASLKEEKDDVNCATSELLAIASKIKVMSLPSKSTTCE